MIRVRKIAHASYEMPDLDKQTEYYTDILGLTLTAKDKDAVYLANTVDHHSVVLRKGDEAQCTRVGFQIGPKRRSQRIREAGADARRQDAAQEGPRADDRRHAHLRGPEGHARSKCSSAPNSPHQRFQRKGRGAAQARPRRLPLRRREGGRASSISTCFGFRVSDWMENFFSFLRCGPDHHTVKVFRTGPNFMHCTSPSSSRTGPICGARLRDACGAQAAAILWGPFRARHWPQSRRSIIAIRTTASSSSMPSSTR